MRFKNIGPMEGKNVRKKVGESEDLHMVNLAKSYKMKPKTMELLI